MPTKSITKKPVTKAVKKVVKKAVKNPIKKVAPVAKKKATTTAKKQTPKKENNFKALVCATNGECFWTNDGRILENLADLHLAFGSMDDEIFLHHVTKEKNDFADWVEYVLQDMQCASDLRKAKQRVQAEKILMKHLKLYTG